MIQLGNKKYLIFIRHAQQDRAAPQPDCGLTKLGQRQAQDVANFLITRWPGVAFEVLSSPKRRCLETMAALKQLTPCNIMIEPLLHEAEANETYQQFFGRIYGFIDQWKASPAPVTIACSHSDWIPEAVRILTKKDTDVRHTGLIEICHHLDQPENPSPFEITLRRPPVLVG